LRRMGKSAKNWSVVSSDRQVQADARAAGADVIPSEAFARQLKKARETAPKTAEERKLSKQEVEDWLMLFKGGRNK
jgi:hypothetical protein